MKPGQEPLVRFNLAFSILSILKNTKAVNHLEEKFYYSCSHRSAYFFNPKNITAHSPSSRYFLALKKQGLSAEWCLKYHHSSTHMKTGEKTLPMEYNPFCNFCIFIFLGPEERSNIILLKSMSGIESFIFF